MPRNDRAPGHVVICCHVPEQLSAAEAARWQAESSARGVPVTWSVAPSDLPAWQEACGSASRVAVRLSGAGLRERSLLRLALRSAAGQVSAVVLEGDQPLEHRDLFVDAGIEMLATEQLPQADRQSRRPSPPGWDCRCLQWGLWEAAFTPPRRRLLGLLEDHRPQPGKLTLLASGGRPGEQPEAGIARLRQTLSQVHTALRSTTVQGCFLSDLPSLLQGGHASADRGSILSAA